ncbi:ABC transporter permease [Desulfolucanica intricata]|uniref:ABC transporter permease n=1 Tax=Desulfolucanica intricata TaxID=1285191 RepID=UPI0008373038|nr:ABC transporter permease [Desulfolucanica intricata]
MPKINPVLLKELRERFRTPKTAILVSLYLLVIGGFSLGFIYLRFKDTAGFFQPWYSKEIFAVLSVVQLVLLAFVTPGLTAGTISGERERQTLNVLLTTKLSPVSIIISKMVSSCSFTVLLLLATLPLYSIVFIFGGISPAQVFGLLGFYLVSMFLFASIGIACSTHFKRTGVSTVTAYGIVFAIGAGTGFLAVFLWEIYRMHTMVTQTPLVVQLLQNSNPVMVLFRILGQNAVLGHEQELFLPYWGIYTVIYLLTGTLLLIWAAIKLNPQQRSKFLLFWK